MDFKKLLSDKGISPETVIAVQKDGKKTYHKIIEVVQECAEAYHEEKSAKDAE